MTLAPDRNWDMDKGHVSDSQTSMFRTCERKHFYAYGERLVPKRTSAGLTRGIIGHEVLETYYLSLQGGATHDEASEFALSKFEPYFEQALLSGDEGSTELLIDLKRRLTAYFEHYKSDATSWEILEVESEYSTTLPSGMSYLMRLDLLVRPKSGPFMGEDVLVDHKFVYDFKREDALAMNSQMPKYLGILSANGRSVRHAVLNQIRTRAWAKKEPTVEDLFRRDDITPSPVEIQTIFREELQIAERIYRFRKINDVDLWRSAAIRTMGDMTCPMCPYSALCKSELQGQDTRLQKMMDFDLKPEETK